MTRTIPIELAEGLERDHKARAVFDALPASHRNHIAWLTSCRTSATRQARAADIVRMLKGYHDARRRELKRRAAITS